VRPGVVLAECVHHSVRIIDEVENEHMVLAGVDAVDARIGLNDLDVAGDRLVDVEGTQLRLVEARLELVGYDH